MTHKHVKYLTLFLVFPVLSYGRLAEKDSPIKTTLCEMYQHPEQYAGKMIEVRATVVGRDFSIEDLRQKCSSWTQIIVVLPEQLKSAPSFELEHDDSLTQWLHNARMKKGVEATLEGRFDVAFVWRDHKRIVVGTDKGYGKKNQYGGRILLHKVSDVVVYPGTHM